MFSYVELLPWTGDKTRVVRDWGVEVLVLQVEGFDASGGTKLCGGVGGPGH